MIDPAIEQTILDVDDLINQINAKLEYLHENSTEVVILFRESRDDKNPPKLELWKAVEHTDYLKEIKNEQRTI